MTVPLVWPVDRILLLNQLVGPVEYKYTISTGLTSRISCSTESTGQTSRVHLLFCQQQNELLYRWYFIQLVINDIDDINDSVIVVVANNDVANNDVAIIDNYIDVVVNVAVINNVIVIVIISYIVGIVVVAAVVVVPVAIYIVISVIDIAYDFVAINNYNVVDVVAVVDVC